MSDANPPITTPSPGPESGFTTWLTVEQIRKMQRMRRQGVIAAMESGELPFERRGRIRYARLSDVKAWEERRIARSQQQLTSPSRVHDALADLL